MSCGTSRHGRLDTDNERINPMRKLLLTTAAVAAAIGLAGCSKKVVQQPIPETQDTLPVITYDTLTDTRDGQTYKTVKIGTQTWMAQNINYKTKGGSWCYNDSTSYCKKYGRLYDWNTATTVCPKGWKLPSREDWDQLAESVGGRKIDNYDSWHDWLDAGKKLKSTSGWYNNDNGKDDVGFSALPGGYRRYNGDFNYAGNYGLWWTASEYSDSYAYRRNMDYNKDHLNENDNGKGIGFSVRCVADRP
jgi:uncharacterized protein (TIGR02145 family)